MTERKLAQEVVIEEIEEEPIEEKHREGDEISRKRETSYVVRIVLIHSMYKKGDFEAAVVSYKTESVLLSFR